MADVLYALEDKLGGIASFTANLLGSRNEHALRQRVLLLRRAGDQHPPIADSLPADSTDRLTYDAGENAYAVARRINAQISHSEGALISNSPLELAACSVAPPGRTVFQIVHDEFNFHLAEWYEPIVDVMIAHSRYYHGKLLERFAHRRKRIVHLPYGIRLSSIKRRRSDGPIRLVFVGRLVEAKGVYDLPLIDGYLSDAGLAARWTVIGDGPERDRLRATWTECQRVRHVTPRTTDEVLQLCSDGDLFVLPTRFEGFPVALLEAMSAGLVPIVSDLPSGVPEVVTENAGIRVPVGDCKQFAQAILHFAAASDQLETISQAARQQAERFDVRTRAPAYHSLFERWREFQQPWRGPLEIKDKSRLDQRWLPNCLTRLLRRSAGHPR